jgi:hypothetical protein
VLTAGRGAAAQQLLRVEREARLARYNYAGREVHHLPLVRGGAKCWDEEGVGGRGGMKGRGEGVDACVC